ncbi:MAG: Glycosyl transferase family 2 [Candidatus Gottesmanbacteria bacterium GW2011_GWA1_43_11]|uniref:Glycosyl transferase family 2 n=1 Tax=Candidatus Gottesmanbacteria bacterium GW2011_GWA1_43_11 TaxID=1618436 RepID=A0A0G1CHF3_9BACT|nr:MAG: Glycosyl transferase family 2 [Candidatus Gottesmanbacteria bacterium GW2011_GWA1_43_11]
MKRKFFSIVIPTLNEEQYLPRLLTTLSQQLFTDFEVIVVDGYSVDKTVTVIHKYQKKVPYPLKLIMNKAQNVGLQRNRGAEAAGGTYLIFFDADIRVEKTYLTQIFTLLKHHPLDFASTWFVIDTPNLLDQVSSLFANIVFYVYGLLGKPFMTGQNLIFKREVFKKLGGFDPTVVHAEDIELVQRAKTHGFSGKIFYSPVHYFSPRRLEREGRFSVWWKYIRSNLYVIFRGPIRVPLFLYEMGGQAKKDNESIK